MRRAWIAFGIIKLLVVAGAAVLCAAIGRILPLCLVIAGFLAMNAMGMPFGLKAGEKSGKDRLTAVALSILIGSAWWGPILSETPKKSGGEGRGLRADGQ
jgi:hypothetical protein